MEEDVRQAFDDMRQEFRATVERFASMHAETRRHFDVIAESLKHEIRLVAQGLQHVDQRVGRTETRLDAIETKVSALDTKLGALAERFDARLTRLESRSN